MKNLYFKSILFCTILFTYSCIQAQRNQNLDLAKIEKLSNSLANDIITSKITPGLTIAVGVDDKIVFAKGYGKADIESGKDAVPQTVFGITSVTKQFTAAAILKLMEQGKIDLENSITTYLPEYPTKGNKVTIKTLLNHTSGTPSMKNTSSIKEENWFSKDLSFNDMLNYFGNQPFEFEPGQKHSYNNFAYYLLGEIITRVSGMPWQEYMEKEMFIPAQLNNTRICDAVSMPPSGAKTYLNGKEGFLIAPTVNKSVLGAAGALCSTVEDLVRWNYLLHSGKIISSNSLQLMKSPTNLSGGEIINEGFGFYLEELEGKKKISHGGALPWGSYLSYYPETGLSIAVLTNSAQEGRKASERIEEALARAILGVEVKAINLSNEEKEIYQGDYVLRLGNQERDFKIFRDDQNNLMAQLQGQQAAQLIYQGDNTFSFVVDPNIRLVFTVDNKMAKGVVLHQGGREVPGERKK